MFFSCHETRIVYRRPMELDSVSNGSMYIYFRDFAELVLLVVHILPIVLTIFATTRSCVRAYYKLRIKLYGIIELAIKKKKN